MSDFYSIEIHPGGDVVEPCLGKIEAQAYVESYNRYSAMTSRHAEMKKVVVQQKPKVTRKSLHPGKK